MILTPPSGVFNLEIVTEIYPQLNTSLEVHTTLGAQTVLDFELKYSVLCSDLLQVYRVCTDRLVIFAPNVKLKGSGKLRTFR